MPKSAPTKLSARAYAAHRGCDPKAVRQALAAGRITGERTESGGWLIDPVTADVQWEERTHPAHGGSRTKGQPAHISEIADAPLPDDPEKIATYNKSLAKEKHYKALMAEIEYQIEIGSLVRKADNDKAVFDFHRIIRDRLLNIPDRIAAVLAGEASHERVHDILTKELRQALTELADQAEATETTAAGARTKKPASPRPKKKAP